MHNTGGGDKGRKNKRYKPKKSLCMLYLLQFALVVQASLGRHMFSALIAVNRTPPPCDAKGDRLATLLPLPPLHPYTLTPTPTPNVVLSLCRVIMT